MAQRKDTVTRKILEGFNLNSPGRQPGVQNATGKCATNNLNRSSDYLAHETRFDKERHLCVKKSVGRYSLPMAHKIVRIMNPGLKNPGLFK